MRKANAWEPFEMSDALIYILVLLSIFRISKTK